MPECCKTGRIQLLLKKGCKTDNVNYHPISNLSSLSKVFERMLFLFTKDIQMANNSGLTSTRQYGFKAPHSTAKIGFILQDKIANCIKKGSLLVICSLDLSAAFDTIDHNLLFRRLIKMGLPVGLISTLQKWLEDRSADMEVDQQNSC